jgi:hypothetical protein
VTEETENEERLSDAAAMLAESTAADRRQINHVGLNRLLMLWREGIKRFVPG